ncbi:coiled-coil domain-containing protein 191 [Leptidea sinapis]|uniref:coiled-coil domain-containing protein 191 n=1 Tax=Leptidea sinapis TaxID=189913 RepID=UPI002136CA46|nr:coiled-coil domain-containing protein 191 [Leptidea sinapis]
MLSKLNSRLIEEYLGKPGIKVVADDLNYYLQNHRIENVNSLEILSDSGFKLMPKMRLKIMNQNMINSKVNKQKKLIKQTDDINTNKFKENSNDLECVTNNKNVNFACHKKDLTSLLIMMTISSQEHPKDELDEIDSEELIKSQNKTDIDGSQEYNTNSSIDTDCLNLDSKFTNTRQNYVARKYLNKWQKYVRTRAKNILQHKKEQSINLFLEKLAKKKNENNQIQSSVKKAVENVRDFSSYQHRFKIQKHIIALQKAKLEEQNKVIEQLKYNKIVEASRESLDSMREEIHRTYYEIDRHLKPKLKTLTNELNLKELQEPSLILHCLKVPQFLQRMEARAREREEKHALIRERRKQMEEERIRLKQQAEIAKAEMDKEEKLRRIKELKDKRKKEKIENIRKKQHAERMRALIVMADLHYEKNLMAKYGIKPLRHLIQMKYDNVEKAAAHYRFQLMKNIFLHWMWHTEDMWFERNYKATDFYRKMLLAKGITCFKKHHYDYILKRQVAEDYCDLYITQLVFNKLREAVKISKDESQMKWKKAVLYHNSNILFKTFTCWRTLPALNALKREQDARKQKWRQKVLLVVPDYKPPDD